MDAAWAASAPVIHLEVGQPDVVPPAHVLAAMVDALARGDTGYTPNAGIGPLRAACADKLQRVNGITRTADEVVITAGSMQGLALTIQAIAEPGGELLIPDPGWPNYAMSARLNALTAVPYPLDPTCGYRPDLERLAAAITPRTVAVVVNSPSNPLGTVITASDLEDIVELCRRRGVWLISDECYDEIVHDGVATSPAAIDGDVTIAVHSFSKTYAMTGLRVGYVSAPPSVATTVTKMQEALVACVNGPAQFAALAALEGPQDFVAERRDIYRRRRDLALVTAAELAIPTTRPDGAFYLWCSLGDGIGDTVEFCRAAVVQHGVAVAPGATFGPGGEGAVRVSLAAGDDDIVAGLGKLRAALVP